MPNLTLDILLIIILYITQLFQNLKFQNSMTKDHYKPFALGEISPKAIINSSLSKSVM